MATKCVTYKAFNDYFTVCKEDNKSAEKAKTNKGSDSEKKSTYVPPADNQQQSYVEKYGFSKYL